MTELTNKIIELIKKNKSINEISLETNLTNKQIYNILTILKNKGINYNRKYYYSGDIVYTKTSILEKKEKTNEINLITTPKEDTLTFLAISDSHIGSVDENLTALKRTYEYAAKKGIKVIIHCGDIIDGLSFGGEKIHKKYIDQIDYFLKNYPYDKNIINFCVLGNHDIDSLTKASINFMDVLNSYRHDFAVTGYGEGAVKIKNDKIMLKHYLLQDSYEKLNIESIETVGKRLKLDGHHHFYSIREKESSVVISVPTISNMVHNYVGICLPSILKITLKFSKYGYILEAIIEQHIIGEEMIKINEITLDLSEEKPKLFKKPENEEEKSKTLTLK